jgi:hypothetical protein
VYVLKDLMAVQLTLLQLHIKTLVRSNWKLLKYHLM